MRKFILVLAGLAIAVTSYAELGNVTVNSYLNQNLDARIPINDALTSIDFDNFRVELASNDKFRQYGLSYNPELGSLRFKVVHNAKKAYLVLTSTKPIFSPVLSFLVHYKLNDNDFYRQYTILLDPIDYANQASSAKLNKVNEPGNKVIIVKNGIANSPQRVKPIPIYGKNQLALAAKPATAGGSHEPVDTMTLENPFIRQHLANFNQESFTYITGKGDNLYDIAKFNQLVYPQANFDLNQVIIALGLKNYRRLYDHNYQYESGSQIYLAKAREIKLVSKDLANEYLWDTSLNANNRLGVLHQIAAQVNSALVIESPDLFIPYVAKPKVMVSPVVRPASQKPSQESWLESILAFLADFKGSLAAIIILIAALIAYKKRKAVIASKLAGLLTRFKRNKIATTVVNEDFLLREDAFFQDSVITDAMSGTINVFTQQSSVEGRPVTTTSSQPVTEDVGQPNPVTSEVPANASADIPSGVKPAKVDEELVSTLEQILTFDSSRDDIRYKLFEIYLIAGRLDNAGKMYRELDASLDQEDGLRKNIATLCSRFDFIPGKAEPGDINSQTNIPETESVTVANDVPENYTINNDAIDSSFSVPEHESVEFNLPSGNDSTEELEAVNEVNDNSSRVLDFVSHPSETASDNYKDEPIKFSTDRVLDFAFNNTESYENNEPVSEDISAELPDSGPGIHNETIYSAPVESTDNDLVSVSECDEKLNLARMYYHIEELDKANEILSELINNDSVPAEVIAQARQLKSDLGLNG